MSAGGENPSEFEFISAESVSPLGHRQATVYADLREEFIEWMRTGGKNSEKNTPLSESSVENYACRHHQIVQWLWSEYDSCVMKITQEQADRVIEALNDDEFCREDGKPYSESSKRKFSDVLEKWFEWRTDQFDADPWEPPIEFKDEIAENPADYFTREERKTLYQTALDYKSVPRYNNLQPEERDRWKAHIAEQLGKPKEDVRPADFKQLNQSWKYPSLVAATLDAGLRPVEIKRMEVSWLRLDKREIHFPKENSAKNREEWDVAIRDRTARALSRWLEQRANKTKYDDRDAVWLNRQGNRYGSSTLNYFLDNLLEETDIDQENRKLVWYSFRHSTGQYVHSESDDLTTATVLRQKDTKSVSRYASPTPEERRGILENIDG